VAAAARLKEEHLMAEMTIRLVCDPDTGKKNIIVSLRSDADALPLEHEQLHQALVNKLVSGGLLKASEAGQIIVEREETKGTPAATESTAPLEERRGQTEGQS
jgi:hypothetical protein